MLLALLLSFDCQSCACHSVSAYICHLLSNPLPDFVVVFVSTPVWAPHCVLLSYCSVFTVVNHTYSSARCSSVYGCKCVCASVIFNAFLNNFMATLHVCYFCIFNRPNLPQKCILPSYNEYYEASAFINAGCGAKDVALHSIIFIYFE